MGYSASALHLIKHLELSSKEGNLSSTDEQLLQYFIVSGYGAPCMSTNPARYRQTSTEDVLRWRDRFGIKYRDQLGDILTWDEYSREELSLDIASKEDTMLHYIAALIDQHGAEAAFWLDLTTQPSPTKLHEAFSECAKRSPVSSFPQLLLGVDYWFPSKNPLVIDEPDWNDKPARYGSIPCLAQEISEIQSWIRNFSNKHRIEFMPEAKQRDSLLALAWDASNVIEKIYSFALQHNIPMWIST